MTIPNGCIIKIYTKRIDNNFTREGELENRSSPISDANYKLALQPSASFSIYITEKLERTLKT